MVLKGLIAATASLALMATPALAAGASSAAASQAASSEVAPAGESVNGMQAFGGRGNIVVILLALTAVGLGIWALWGGDGDDSPASP